MSVYAYNELVKLKYSPEQKQMWGALVSQVNTGEISMNQAFRKASSGDYMGAYSSFEGSFADWMNTAQSEGWVDSAVAVGNALTQNQQNTPVAPTPPAKPNKGLLIALGVLTVGVIAMAVYQNKKK